jgi:hypothetical protein
MRNAALPSYGAEAISLDRPERQKAAVVAVNSLA